jgi:hypothetical protein
MATDQELDDAIQSDVPDAATDAPKERPKSRRELAMEELDISRMAALEKETGVKLTDDTPVAAPPKTQADEQLEAQLAQPTLLENIDGLKVRAKIDGEEQDVSVADMLRAYQKNGSADKRLEEATRLLKEAEARAQAIPIAAPPPPTESTPPPPPLPVPDDTELKGKVKAALASLYAGDEEAATASLYDVIKANRSVEKPATPAPAIDINQLADQLQQRLAVETAFATIKTDYPDLLANKDLETLAVIKTQTKEASGMTRAAAMLESAQEVYQAIGKTVGTPPLTKQDISRAEKLERKGRLESVPTASAAAVQPETQEPSSPSALIAEMRAKRLGQSG